MDVKKFYDYEHFIGKFEPKRTTDECFTPEAVYEAVLRYVDEEVTPLDGRHIVRPFFPDGDYKAYEYKDGDIVIDNPPFSKLAEILDFYLDRHVDFFIFIPALTPSSALRRGACVIVGRNSIRYENGAIVSTAFATNLFPELRVKTAPRLSEAIKRANKGAGKANATLLYPRNLTTVAKLQRIGNVDFSIGIGESEFSNWSKLYGGGLLLSDAAAERLAAAERRSVELRADAAETGDESRGEFLRLPDRDIETLRRLNGLQ